ncbi:MAG: type II secretion system protein [Limisphaerales bacterium]
MRLPNLLRGIGLLLALHASGLFAQSLINIDFGVGDRGSRVGFAATGLSSNDVWNLHSHYRPRLVPGQEPVPDGRLDGLLFADGTKSPASLSVSNAPGVWGNSSGDPMWDAYVYAANGSNLLVTLTALPAGQYHVYLYGRAEADVAGEQDSVFTLTSGTNRWGPRAASGGAGWRAGSPMRPDVHYVLFRDVAIEPDAPLRVEVAPGTHGVAVLNGLQILSLGTSAPRPPTDVPPPSAGVSPLAFREVRYEGLLSTHEARFETTIRAEAGPGESTGVLFEGDLAILEPELPENWRITRQGSTTLLVAGAPGEATVRFQLVARVERQEPWNFLSFKGPASPITALAVASDPPHAQIQILRGTTSNSGTNDIVTAALGAEPTVELRWQSRTTEVVRQSHVTAESRTRVKLTPAGLQQVTDLHYEVLQGALQSTRIALSPGHSLTRLDGDQVRDWRVETDGDESVLSIEFIRPIEKALNLTLVTDHAVEGNDPTTLTPVRPLGIQRESGAVAVSAEDVLVRIESSENLRQINARTGEVAAFRFFGRPASATVRVEPLLPEISVDDQVAARLEETRLVVTHRISAEIARAGVYSLECALPPDFLVTAVRGEGLDSWKTAGDRLRLSLAQRALGRLSIEVDLERGLSPMPPSLVLTPLPVAGAVRETARIGVVPAPGFRLKTEALTGAREVPAATERGEALAYRADRPAWSLSLGVERLQARVVAEVFNLLTIGDGLVGGSATLRYGILNQGLQQLRLRLPAHWRNVEFTGPGIRRKDQQGDVWTLSLQDKAWDGYTLVLTYDHEFDPKGATLNGAAPEVLDVERQTGYVAVTTAAALKLEPSPPREPLRAIDPVELPETDRKLITRPVLLAYRYTGGTFDLTLRLTRHEEFAVLDAVADRIQLTTVLTDAGEMLTQASFMVKNNDRQFQRFQLPKGATLWGVYVNGEPVKAESDGDWLLVSLPRAANRDQAFAVDLKYAQQLGPLGRFLPQPIELVAPGTDVPSTYGEWELYVPDGRRLSGFGGTMTPLRGTTYGIGDAWDEFIAVYRGLWFEYGARIIVGTCVAAFFIALYLAARRFGFGGVTQVLVVFMLVGILASMLLPALSKAKAKSTRIKSVNNLKQIGIAARVWATDNGERLPPSFEAMAKELGSDKVLLNPENGRPYVYLGANKSEADPNGILAYGENPDGGYSVVMVDGSVQILTATKFQDALSRSEKSAVDLALQLDPGLRTRYGLAAAATAPGAASPTAPAAAAAAGAAAQSAQTQAASGPVLPVATAPGLRSIRIEVPRSGRPFHFAKVLNLKSEPLRIHARIMRQRVWTGFRMVFEVSAFLVGLALVGWTWSRPDPRAWKLALGAVLVIVSAVSLFIAWRILHLVLILGLPLVVFLAIGNLISIRRKARQNRRPNSNPPPPSPDSGQPPIQPVAPLAPAATLLLAGCFALVGVERLPAAVPPVPAPSITLVSGSYSGTVAADVARLEATFNLVAHGTNQSLPLFQGDVAVESFQASTPSIRLWREGSQLGIHVPDSGTATLDLSLLVKPDGDVTRRRLAFAVPTTLASRFDLVIDEPDAEIEFPSAVTFRRSTVEAGTRVEGLIGAGGQVELAWTPRVKRAAEVAATVFVEQAALITIGSGVANIRSSLNYQVTQGELRRATLVLPPGHRLLRVEGPGLKTWDLGAAEPFELTVELARAITGSLTLTVETEKVLGPIPASLDLEIPRATEVRRETGIVAIRAGDDVALSPEKLEGLQRVDAAEFQRATKAESEAGAFVGVYRYLRPDFRLSTRAELIEPEIEATVRQAFVVGTEQLGLTASFEFEVRRLGAFQLGLRLPAGWRLETVVCPFMDRWAELGTDDDRVLEIALKRRTLGRIPVVASLVRTLDGLPPTVDLPGVHPVGVAKVTGFIEVGSEPGVGLKTGTTEDLVEIPIAALGGPSMKPTPTPTATATAPSLAFKYVSAAPGRRPPWRLAMAIEQVESWIRAEVAHVVALSETLVTGRSMVRFEIQNAPARVFSIQVPAAWRNVELVGDDIRRRDVTNGVWTVELQNKARGHYPLTVLWEQARGTNPAPWQLTGFAVPRVERETGFVTLLARPPLQVSPAGLSGDLTRIDVQEVPEWAGVRLGSDPGAGPGSTRRDSAVLAWRYLRPGYSLAVEVQRYSDAAVLQALVEQARLTTVVAEDGQAMTHMRLTVRNNGRQLLEVRLPPDSTLWSASVSGQPVRPRQNAGGLFLPLDGSGDPEAPVAIELTYVGAHRFPANRGRVALDSPQLDVPLKDARWDVFLPPDYDYTGFGGSMNHEFTDQTPLALDFTLAEYRRQEEASEEAQLAELRQVVDRARHQLSRGMLGFAENELGSLRGGKLKTAESTPEVRQLREELSRRQSSNFIQAQNEFVYSNAGRLASESQAATAGSAQSYTSEAAGRQAVVVQKAQAVSLARVQPLRVNLPKRGIRHSFNQVLQTEGRRPLTVYFEARNTQRTGWIRPTLLALAGFAFLWAVAGAALLFRPQPNGTPEHSRTAA